MYPISRTNPSITQGPKSSDDFNNLCRDVIYDINSLFQANHNNSLDTAYNMDTVMIENFFLQARINELETKLATIQATISTKRRQQTASFKTISTVRDTTSNAFIDINNGIIMNNHDIISKNLVKNQDDVYVAPAELIFNVYESTNGIDYVPIEDNQAMRTFDSKQNSIWHHASKFAVNTSIDKLYIALHIKLPNNYNNNVLVNSINIKPFPEYSMQLTNIKYSTPGSTVMHSLPTLPESTTIIDLQNILLHFPAIEIENLYIFLEQPCYFIDENYKYFYYGMQEIGVNYLDFTTDVCYITNEFNLPTGQYFLSINEPTVTAAVGCPQNVQDLVSHYLWFDQNKITAGISEHPFGESISENYSKIYILTEVKQGAGFSPVLEGITINYTTK